MNEALWREIEASGLWSPEELAYLKRAARYYAERHQVGAIGDARTSEHLRGGGRREHLRVDVAYTARRRLNS